MGTVIIALTLGMALFKGAMVGGMRKVMPYMQSVGTWLMLIAGTYIVFYWLTIGNVPGVTRKSTIKKKRRPPIELAGVSYPTIFPTELSELAELSWAISSLDDRLKY